MVLTAPQRFRIATTYEHASADKELPVYVRSAFAKKASRFRMVAEIRAMAQSVSQPGFEAIVKSSFGLEALAGYRVGQKKGRFSHRPLA